MFENLRNALEAEHAARIASTTEYIQSGYYPHWAEEHRKNPDDGLKRYSTPAKWAAYQAGTLSREKAVQLATARALRELRKTYVAYAAKLDEATNAPTLEFITINTDWKKSATWGYNPSTIIVTNEADYFKGTASDCGYDKGPAAIADALNKSPAVLKMLYAAADKALEAGQTFDRLNECTVTWRYVLGYGSGYSIVPYFEGGCGVSCFESIFNACGYRFRNTASGRLFDAYIVEKKEA